MIASVSQRWRAGRTSYRPAGEPIATRLYNVAEIPDDLTAKVFVVKHHYSASYPAALFRVGLHRSDELVGIAVFSQPIRADILDVLPGDSRCELGRVVLLDDVPANGESWFLARAFELARARFDAVLSHSDPFRYVDDAGRTVMPGHVGTIYQASNAPYFGQARPRTIRLFADGRVCSARLISKIRAGERGWRYAAARLVEAGAAPLTGDPRAWLATWLPRVTRTVRHPGNHRYGFALDRRLRRHLPASLPYPKLSLESLRGAA